MGFFILGIIIFILMLLFVNDLFKQYKERNKHEQDIFYRRVKPKYQNEFSEDFMNDNLEHQIETEKAKVNDMGVEPIWSNIEHMAFQQEIHRKEDELHDVIPDDPDYKEE